jgi:hypothetical protein
MNILEVLSILLYGGALILVAYFIVGLMRKSTPPAVVVYDETPVASEYNLYPWYSPYNWYYTWSPWSYWSGGDSGYYGRRWGPHHGGNRPWGGAGRGANRGGFGSSRGGFGGGRSGGCRSGGGGGRR